MVERLSLTDDTFFSSYSDHIMRYQFAETYCAGRRVLDAGCGIGYGSAHLARSGAEFVLGIDISDQALSEARSLFQLPNVRFAKQDVQEIGDHLGHFDIIVNFENIEHIQNPVALVSRASKLLPGGTFITSTPNGEISTYGSDGKLINEFHVKEFTSGELFDLLSPHFKSVKLFGQWLTPAGKLRQIRARQLFEALNALYYNPMQRIGRSVLKLLGRKTLAPLDYFGGADVFQGDYIIDSLNQRRFPWEPTVILAVCSN